VKTHDFVDPKLGRAVPYGVYDLANDEGWVSVGERADTAEFAVETIRRWWRSMAKPRFEQATRLLITADAGGSNGYRVRAWKRELARLAEETGLEITVCQYRGHLEVEQDRSLHRVPGCLRSNQRGRLTPSRTSATSLPRALSITSSMSSYTLPLR